MIAHITKIQGETKVKKPEENVDNQLLDLGVFSNWRKV